MRSRKQMRGRIHKEYDFTIWEAVFYSGVVEWYKIKARFLSSITSLNEKYADKRQR